jgi:hypothetical protein
MSFEDDLLKIKTNLDKDEKTQSESKIKSELILEGLKKNFNCNSLEEAEIYQKELINAKKDLQNELSSGIIELRNELGIE